jgi:hypothetical protein
MGRYFKLSNLKQWKMNDSSAVNVVKHGNNDFSGSLRKWSGSMGT